MITDFLSIILYGSHARKDNDPDSDYDVCVITKTHQNKKFDIDELKKYFQAPPESQITPIYYPEQMIKSMLEYGSLFLWHLNIEGQVLYGEKYFSGIIKSLKPFQNHHYEIMYHRKMYSDFLRSFKYINLPNELDLALFFTIARNICMILAHKKEQPAFGRLSCFEAAKTCYSDLPIKRKDYIYLSNFKLIYERGSMRSVRFPTYKKFYYFIEITEKLLKYAERKTK